MSLFPLQQRRIYSADREVTASLSVSMRSTLEKGTLWWRIVTGVDALCVSWAYLALKAKRYRLDYIARVGDEVYDLIGYSYSEEYQQ